MANNQEPTSELLRLRDVLAWQPTLTRDELYELEEAKVIKVFRKSKRAQRWYYKSNLKAKLGLA